MNRRTLLNSFLGLIAAGVGLLVGSRAEAAEYKYKCVRSGKIHTYSKKGNYKCPEHSDHNLVPTK